MKLIAYLRVSTSDKGQDPDRQKVPILARAKEDGHEVIGWVVDEGTSGGVNAMDRPKVIEALKLARSLKAGGLIVEAVDRWTRAGPQDLGVSMFYLERDHGLKLLFADLKGDEFVVELLGPLMATLAKAERQRLRKRVAGGMALARAKGSRLGRPPKDAMTEAEYRRCITLLQAGDGWRVCADEVSRLRGADQVVDEKARKARTVGQAWVRDSVANRAETRVLLARVVAPAHRQPCRNEMFPAHPAEAAA